MRSYQFSELIFHVTNLERSIDFYVNTLGCELEDREEFMGHHLAHLRTGNLRLFLLQEPPAWPPAWHHLGAMLHFVVGNDIEALHQRFISIGAPIYKELSQGPWGDRMFILSDPDGYKIMFSERGE